MSKIGEKKVFTDLEMKNRLIEALIAKGRRVKRSRDARESALCCRGGLKLVWRGPTAT